MVSAVGRGNLGSEKAKGCREFRDEKTGQGDFVATMGRFQEIEGGMGKVASGGWTGMRRAYRETAENREGQWELTLN